MGPAGVAPFSLCIVNHDGAHCLAATLGAIRELEPAPAEVILVDNASTDASVDIAWALMPGLHVLAMPHNDGPGPARDAGYRASTGARVLVIDNDVMPAVGCAAALSRALDAHPDACLAMATICHAEAPGTVQFDGAGAHALGMMSLENAEVSLATAPAGVREIGSLVTACFMVDRARWGEEPLCDPSFFFHFEDHELGLRARLLGRRLITAPAALALHGSGTPDISLRATGRFTATRVYYTIRNRWHIILKFYELRTLMLLAPALLLFEALQLAGAARRGWLGHWLRAAAWIMCHARDLRRRRNGIQARRRLPDAALLHAGPPPFATRLLKSSFERRAARLLTRVTDACWARVTRELPRRITLAG